MESNLGRYAKNATMATAALLAGAAVAKGVSTIPEPVPASAESTYLDSCLTDYARLPSRHGLSAHVVNAHVIEVGAKALDMRTLEPTCDNAEVKRFTNVEVDQNGHRIAKIIGLINQHNDHGHMLIQNVSTSTPVVCGAEEKVLYTTHAQSRQAPGADVTDTQSFSFKTVCS